MRTEEFTCDNPNCKASLNYAGESHFRMTLCCNELHNKPTSGGWVYSEAVIRIPPIERTMHFCDMKCLRLWWESV